MFRYVSLCLFVNSSYVYRFLLKPSSYDNLFARAMAGQIPDLTASEYFAIAQDERSVFGRQAAPIPSFDNGVYQNSSIHLNLASDAGSELVEDIKKNGKEDVVYALAEPPLSFNKSRRMPKKLVSRVLVPRVMLKRHGKTFPNRIVESQGY